ncbi:hypothetical protein B0O99DRAFT_699768 [Bisporella sp. PMI_857]|nr:hypothetical protein B0O99DRAFT_699768 [Bisporella sp. PMI_857]
MGLWKWILALFAFRFFWALGSGILLHRKARSLLRPNHVFLPAVSTTWSPLMELDFNLHKSNSTYFTDLDVSRAYLSGVLFGPLFLGGIDGRRCNFIVGNVSCSFRREIKPYQRYEIWTRVASWDDKWIYMVTHFVERYDHKSARCVLQPGTSTKRNGEHTKPRRAKGDSRVLASAITQFVCKRGRVTVPPAQALAECGLLESSSNRHNAGKSPDSTQNNMGPALPSTDATTHRANSTLTSKNWASLAEDLETFRIANLPVVRLLEGWNRVYDLFEDEELVLGQHHGMV